MAAEKSICIDYAGREKLKIFPQSKNSKLLVSNLLNVNGLKILNSKILNSINKLKWTYYMVKGKIECSIRFLYNSEGTLELYLFVY